jgi:hypothetical protein
MDAHRRFPLIAITLLVALTGCAAPSVSEVPSTRSAAPSSLTSSLAPSVHPGTAADSIGGVDVDRVVLFAEVTPEGVALLMTGD